MRARWVLAVCGVMPATRASSEAVSARPSISACSMPARAGSPASAATWANSALVAMASSLVATAVWAQQAARCFGAHRSIPAAGPRTLAHLTLWRGAAGDDHHDDASGPARPFLRLARGGRRLRARDLRLGHGLLRSPGVPERRHGRA